MNAVTYERCIKNCILLKLIYNVFSCFYCILKIAGKNFY